MNQFERPAALLPNESATTVESLVDFIASLPRAMMYVDSEDAVSSSIELTNTLVWPESQRRPSHATLVRSDPFVESGRDRRRHGLECESHK